MNNTSSNKLFEDIRNSINEIRIFDTHEHLMYESERRTKKLDFFTFFSGYASTDLMSAGLKLQDFQRLRNQSVDLKTKWDIFYPYWELIKNTTYSRVIITVAKDIYGVNSINLDNIEKITDKINKFKGLEYYKDILKEKSKIEFVLNDLDINELGIEMREPDEDYFLPVMRFDDIFELNSAEKIAKLEQEKDINIHSLSDFIDLIDKTFEERKNKIYAFKIGIAYNRSIFFEDVVYADAEKSFLKVLKLDKFDSYQDSIPLLEIKPFQDYMYHYCIRKAIKYGLPIQIHTGILEGNYNDLRNSNPLYLTKLLLKYREAKFDIFHIGYPFTDELIAMIKMYPNCYINLCWIPQISKNLYKNALNLIIEILPSNKVFGFGGDYFFVEGTYAAQKIAREAIIEVLYEKVLHKYFSIEEAIGFAKRILNSNPKNVYLK